MKKERYGKTKYRKVMAAITASFVLASLTGCGGDSMDPLVPANSITYADAERSTVMVMRGDIAPTFEGNLKLSNYSEYIYRLDNSQIAELKDEYKAEIDEVLVEVGDRVSVGDKLITFNSESLAKQMINSTTSKTKSELLINHYRKLMDINSGLDYYDEIVSLENDVSIANMYIDDINSTYDEIDIVSETEGVVSFVDSGLGDGNLVASKPLVKVASYDEYYVMDNPLYTTEADKNGLNMNSMEFHVGERYTAKSYLSEYTVEVIADPTGGSATATDAVIDASATDASSGEAVTGNLIYFKIVDDDGSIPDENLVLYAELDVTRDVCYVEKNAVFVHEGQSYVYLECEDGSFQAKKVTTGDIAGIYVIIEDGLNEGDRVSIPE